MVKVFFARNAGIAKESVMKHQSFPDVSFRGHQ
jgi:hypothetical protein